MPEATILGAEITNVSGHCDWRLTISIGLILILTCLRVDTQSRMLSLNSEVT